MMEPAGLATERSSDTNEACYGLAREDRPLDSACGAAGPHKLLAKSDAIGFGTRSLRQREVRRGAEESHVRNRLFYHMGARSGVL